MRMWILEREYQTLCRLQRPVRPANYQTGFDHDVEIPKWEEDEDGRVRNDRIDGGDVDLGQLVERNDADAGWASYYEDYSVVPITGRNQAEGNVTRTAIVCKLQIDIGLPESKLSGDLPELRGYLLGRLGLWVN